MKNNNKRRPKGMGSVTNLGKGRRKPFLAIIGDNSLGTYKTKEDAEKVLLQYVLDNESMYPEYINDNDSLKKKYTDFIYDLQSKGILSECIFDFGDMETFNDLFESKMLAEGAIINTINKTPLMIDNVPTFKEIWEIEYERLEKGKSDSWRISSKGSFKNLAPLHDLKITNIKTAELQNTFDYETSRNKCGIQKLNKMLGICHTIFSYAIKMDYVEKDYSQFVNLVPTAEPKKNRKPFTIEEVKKILHTDTEEAKLVSLYIFTGARPIELVGMKRENIHLDENYMVGGAKTEAGKNRIIPIHPAIKPIIKYFLETYNYDYLFSKRSTKTDYIKYNTMYNKCIKSLNLNDHVEPYDTRYTFSTLAKIYHLDTAAHKKIMGHTCNDITDDVYTHEPLEYLLNEIKKIDIS